MDKVKHIHGVSAEKVEIKFDFSQALSSSINKTIIIEMYARAVL